MPLKAPKIAERLKAARDPLVVTPRPDIAALERDGSAALDLRLGCWFTTLRQSRVKVLSVYEASAESPHEYALAQMHYVPFGKEFVLHPRNFVLGVTLEWVRLPIDLSGYVVGKSSWGRHGLIIATAIGVHPGFTGCLTLELSNVGEIPIAIKPGTPICQLFLHEVGSDSPHVDKSQFVGRRRPTIAPIALDSIAKKLGTEHA